MLTRQLFDPRSSTWTYLLADRRGGSAVLIDSVFEQQARDAALIAELELRLLYTLETHVHADHVTAAWLFRERLGSRIAVAAASGAVGMDRALQDGDEVRFGEEGLRVLATPGHTNGCITYVSRDRLAAFTGDALLIRAAGRTDFQDGDARRLYRSVHDRLFTLPDDCVIHPGHDYQGRTVSSVWEEKHHNPRLGGARSEEDFVGFMANLGLPHPKQIDIAVPANLRCGKPDGAGLQSGPPAWAPVVRSYAGIPQVQADWLGDRLAEVCVLDVREPAEFDGELGHVPGARLLPLGELRSRLGELAKDRPIVTVCRSGGRSAQAALILESAGFTRVANLDGGMVRWRGLDLPVAGTADRT